MRRLGEMRFDAKMIYDLRLCHAHPRSSVQLDTQIFDHICRDIEFIYASHSVLSRASSYPTYSRDLCALDVHFRPIVRLEINPTREVSPEDAGAWWQKASAHSRLRLLLLPRQT